jgi:hypothetical protein
VKRAAAIASLAFAASGCGETHIHTGAEVKAGFARHGVDLQRFEVGRAQGSDTIDVYRLPTTPATWLGQLVDLGLTLGSRTADSETLVGDNIFVIVLRDNVIARSIARQDLALRRFDNLLVVGDGPRVDAALADLR